MHKVRYEVYVTSSLLNMSIHYEDKPNHGVVKLITLKRVVVPTKGMTNTPWTKTVELPEGTLALVEAGYDGGPKHKNLTTSIYVDGKWTSSDVGSNTDSVENDQLLDSRLWTK